MSNNENLITNHKYISNDRLSDHDTIISQLNIVMDKPDDTWKDECISDTKIPLFNLPDASSQTWKSYSEKMESLNWYEEKKSCNNLNEKVKTLCDTIENVVSEIFPMKKKKMSGNRIPKQIRKSFRKKTSLSKKIRKTKNAKKLMKLKEELRDVENNITNGIKDRRRKAENKVIAKVVFSTVINNDIV